MTVKREVDMVTSVTKAQTLTLTIPGFPYVGAPRMFRLLPSGEDRMGGGGGRHVTPGVTVGWIDF